VRQGTSKENPVQRIFAIALLANAACGTVAAQDEPSRSTREAALELTMTLMPANAETPDAVMRTLELPKDTSGNFVPSTAGVVNSGRGLDTANAAREDGRAFGAAAAAAASENRENASRASRPPREDRPAPPETPDRPAPPAH
jgi:hypothetical protein